MEDRKTRHRCRAGSRSPGRLPGEFGAVRSKGVSPKKDRSTATKGGSSMGGMWWRPGRITARQSSKGYGQGAVMPGSSPGPAPRLRPVRGCTEPLSGLQGVSLTRPGSLQVGLPVVGKQAFRRRRPGPGVWPANWHRTTGRGQVDHRPIPPVLARKPLSDPGDLLGLRSNTVLQRARRPSRRVPGGQAQGDHSPSDNPATSGDRTTGVDNPRHWSTRSSNPAGPRRVN
ncbi:MAG: hypothetical protein Ct9H300mP31_16580 [Acidimicrobiaceae bacterium]|nr:MAG: hypothetical protein Ct9H300mP31_16580 [Acidimicrobiaceae bacterium]